MRYRFIIAAAWLSLMWERLWPALWPAAGLAAILVALSLLGIWQSLPAGIGAVALGLYLATLVVALVAGLWGFRPPSRAETLRWVERRHGLTHRPITSGEDRPATPDAPDSAALWQSHQARAAAAWQKVSPKLPHPRLAARDPWGLRILVGLVLAVAVIVGGHRWQESLTFLIAPPFGYELPEPEVTAWLDPPAYTGQRPRTIEAGPAAAPQTVTVPAGTTLRVSVAGAPRTPVLETGSDSKAMTRADENNHSVSLTPGKPGRYSVALGAREIAAWQVDITPDRPPKAGFPQKPGVTERKSLNFHYQVSDDYGVESAEIRLSRPDGAETVTVPLHLTTGTEKQQGSVYENLTAHPWAGLTVIARVAAQDGRGQTGVSERVSLRLPEREFNHPIAQELIQLRKYLVTESVDDRHIARRLMRLSMQPKRFGDDLVAYLAMRTAAHRVTSDAPNAHETTISLLWDTALRIEDGNAGLAERKMRDALDKLKEAMAEKSGSRKELSKKLDKFKRALAEYMKALAEQQRQEAKRNRPQSGNAPDQQAGQQMTPETLSRMMERIEKLAEAGSMAEAKKLLAKMQAFLENMKVAQDGGARNRQMNAGRKELSALRQKQQSLMDETYRQPQHNRNAQGQGRSKVQKLGQSGSGAQGRQQEGSRQGQTSEAQNGQSLAKRQQGLRAGLKQTAQKMQAAGASGGGKKAMQAAGQAMAAAEKALKSGAPGRAVKAQAEAIKALSQAEQALAQQQTVSGARGRDGGSRGLGRADPRQRMVPTEGDLGRAREILEEIRRRASEWQRPELELDYLNRLLERF